MREILASLALAMVPWGMNGSETAEAPLRFTLDGTTLSLTGETGLPVLDFHHAIHPAPEGQDPAYARGGFIHPLRTPSGQVLTRIQPPDHWHHYGLWNPWTRVEYDGAVYDLWNLHHHEGTVRFTGFEDLVAGPKQAGFTALLDHVAFTGEGRETVILRERQTVTVYRQTAGSVRVVDVRVELTVAAAKPVTLQEYRYGGFCLRGPEGWNASTSTILTSEGHTHADADGTLARWVRVEGQLGAARGGLAMLDHPRNFNHPVPLRVWPLDMHEGQVFVNLAPTKNRSWTLEPASPVVLRYRLLTFDGDLSVEAIEQAWTAFAEAADPAPSRAATNR